MSACYVVCISLACFGVGLGVGLVVPFLFLSVYERAAKSFDLGDMNLEGAE